MVVTIAKLTKWYDKPKVVDMCIGGVTRKDLDRDFGYGIYFKYKKGMAYVYGDKKEIDKWVAKIRRKM